MNIDFNDFNDLREQLYNPQLWDKKRFIVLSYEAGSGKTFSALKFIGEMAKDSTYKVLYVQRFVKDNAMDNTVDAINRYAGKEVAVGFSGEDRLNKEKKEHAIQAPVLCITHNMYSKICKGSRQELIDGRDILVIDEYPDLLEKVSVSLDDIGIIGVRYPEFESMFRMLRDKFHQNKREDALSDKGMLHCSFKEIDYDVYRNELDQMINRVQNKKHKDILRNLQQILKNGCYLFEDGFHTFNSDINFAMRANNIILDANAGFDYRYQMSDKFVVKNQKKKFTYENSKFHHIEINTSKQALSNYINFQQKILEMNVTESRKRVLFITDLAGTAEWENCIEEYRCLMGENSTGPEKMEVDHYGNLNGLNNRRDFDTVVIAKTPNYDFLTYALTYFFYRSKDRLPVDHQVKLFEHDEIETLRATTVAGEIYQAIKRINRDNSQSSQIYVFTDYQEAIDIVLNQLPNIEYVKETFEVHKKRSVKVKFKEKESSVSDKQIQLLQNLLLACIHDRRKSVKKKELRDKIGISNNGKANFTRIIQSCEPFMKEHGIMMTKGQQIYFNIA